MPDRAEMNSTKMRAVARVVPLRTVNERLKRGISGYSDSGRERATAVQLPCNIGPPVHVRGPARANWSGGKPLLGYNSLGHDALDPPSRARCAKPRPALRLTTGRVGALYAIRALPDLCLG
jgi:hypothetical protein